MKTFKQFITEDYDTTQRNRIINDTFKRVKHNTINGNVQFWDTYLEQLPDLSSIHITGCFDGPKGDVYYSGKLKSLKGSPKLVDGWFKCRCQQLTDLVGSPKYVGCDFDCTNNPITSLQGAPNYVGGTFKTDKFSDADYREYIEYRKMKKELDPETSDLFGGMIDTL